jgi:hypothetical protein
MIKKTTFDKLDEKFQVLNKTSETFSMEDIIANAGNMRRNIMNSKLKTMISVMIGVVSVCLLVSMMISLGSVPVLLESYSRETVFYIIFVALYLGVMLFLFIMMILGLLVQLIKAILKNILYLSIAVPIVIVLFPMLLVASVFIVENFF